MWLVGGFEFYSLISGRDPWSGVKPVSSTSSFAFCKITLKTGSEGFKPGGRNIDLQDCFNNLGDGALTKAFVTV